MIDLWPNGAGAFQNRAHVKRLFDRFFALETARNATDLGLSIARLLTERMNGAVRAEYRGETPQIRVSFPQ